MHIKICEKYVIHLCDDLITGYKDGKFNDACEPYIRHVLNPKLQSQLSRCAWCWEKLVQNVRSKATVESVIDLFGGVGRSAVIIQNELEPLEHTIYDYSKVMVEHLFRLFGWRIDIQVHQLDTYQALLDGLDVNADLVVFDHNHFTLRSLFKDDIVTQVLAQVFACNPLFVQLVDLALPYLHLNKAQYEKLSGYAINTFDDYINALSAIIEERWGYGITFVAHYSNIAAILLEPLNVCPDIIETIDARDHPESLNYWRITDGII